MKLLAVFLRHSWRYHTRHPVLTLLNVLGIAAGLAVFTSIRTINSSSLAAFAAGAELVTGPVELTIRAEGDRFDESVFESVQAVVPEVGVSPIVEELALLPDRPGDYLQFVGFDPILTSESVRLTVPESGGNPSSGGWKFLTNPAAIALPPKVAARLGLQVGDSLKVNSPGGVWNAQVVAIVEVESVGLDQMDHVALMDIAALQDRYQLVGRLNRLDLLLPDSADRFEIQECVQRILPPNLRVEPPDAQQVRFEKITQAFRLNLMALSLISLLVGCFLVYNTLTAAVVRRRREWGVLRAIGLRANELQWLVIAEAVVLAIPSSLLGMGLGLGLAWGLLQPVLSSLTSNYVRIQASVFSVQASDLFITFVAGLVTVIIAAWRPGREAARLSVVEALQPVRSRAADLHLLRRRWMSLVVTSGLLAILAWALLDGLGIPWLGFAFALFVLMGFALLAPVMAEALFQLRSAWGPKASLLGALAAQNFLRGQSRIAITVAALVVALAMGGGLSIMVHSFRITVGEWISETVRADLYVAPASNFQLGVGERLPPEVLKILSERSELAAMNVYRETTVELNGEPTRLAATHLAILEERHPPKFLAARSEVAEAGEVGIWISDVLARKRGLQSGDRLEVATPTGLLPLRVLAIYQDFSSEQGQILMDLPLYQRFWRDSEIHSAALYFRPEADRAKFRSDLAEGLAAYGKFTVVSNEELRSRALQIFDQTFAITDVLKWMALGIAMLGVTISLLTLIAERTREWGLLRAAGMTRRQVTELVGREAVWIAITASVLGLAASFALAAILAFVINVRFFGWTIEWHVPWVTMGLMPIVTILAAILAAVWPAYRAGKLPIAAALREEE